MARLSHGGILTTGLVVRPAVPEDAEQIAPIFEHYVLETLATFETSPPSVVTWQERITELTEAGFPFLVAEEAGSVEGYAYVTPWRSKPAYRYTVEDVVYVAPGRHRRGTGGRLLAELLAQCVVGGFRRVVAVIARTDTPASESLHRAHGFTTVGVLEGVGYKQGRSIDTLLMQCRLDEPGAT